MALALCSVGLCSVGSPALSVAEGVGGAPIDFNADVRPVFVEHCLACHGGVKQAGGMSLIHRETALGETDSGEPSVYPGDVEASYLFDRVTEEDDDFRMPPAEHGRRLNAEEVDLLRRWIEAGAPWNDPWSFEKPEPQTTVGNDREAIDTPIEAAARAAGLEPAAPAADAAWLRRVSFDLVGLPPTPEHRDRAASGLTEDDRERVVNELLASKHFGERWAAMWLDLARYADTTGFERDPHRDAWPYRDWVIRALNADTPYDEFLTKQLAGDLLDDPSMDDLVATAFHRNTLTNIEGGTDDEEFRIAAVVDRVDTTGQALLGLTMACARCHDHPYDPVSQADYYRFFDFFNSTRDCDLREDWPVVKTPFDPERYDEARALDRELSANSNQQFARVAPLAADLSQWRGVTFTEAVSTGQTTLTLRDTPIDETNRLGLPAAGGNEIATAGTVTDKSVFDARATAAPMRVTALRLDAVPEDPEAAAVLPQMGFVLARLRVWVTRQAAEPDVSPLEEPVTIVAGFSDEAEPFMPADESLEDSEEGWSAYTKQRVPRWAVFVLDEPLELGEGDTLRFEFKHGKSTDGQGALVIRRLRAALSADTRWPELARDEAFVKLRTRAYEIRAARADIPSCPTPVMAERPAPLRRQTRL
ncbi:MAG: DUF1549 domain-containing protein, partial [Planctomycetota bacterium]